MDDPYDVLELPRDADAAAIKLQYRFLVQAWHPDKFMNAQHKLLAEQKIKAVNAAYAVLSGREQPSAPAGRAEPPPRPAGPAGYQPGPGTSPGRRNGAKESPPTRPAAAGAGARALSLGTLGNSYYSLYAALTDRVLVLGQDNRAVAFNVLSLPKQVWATSFRNGERVGAGGMWVSDDGSEFLISTRQEHHGPFHFDRWTSRSYVLDAASGEKRLEIKENRERPDGFSYLDDGNREESDKRPGMSNSFQRQPVASPRPVSIRRKIGSRFPEVTLRDGSILTLSHEMYSYEWLGLSPDGKTAAMAGHEGVAVWRLVGIS